MSTQNEIVWIEPPEEMIINLEGYEQELLAVVTAVAQFIGTKMQNEARRNATWQDRTGNARSGLFSQVVQEAAGEIVAIYLSHGHTIDYGVYLEQNYGGRYAIIMPTIQKNLPELETLLQGLFK